MANETDFIIYSDSFREILLPESRVMRLAEGLKFTEGPVWLREADCLLFSDLGAGKIMRWSERDGLSVWRDPSNFANGNTLDANGSLITCEHGTRRVTATASVARAGQDSGISILAQSYAGKRLNSPNDIVVKSDRTIWFTDPPYGIRPEQVEQPANYVFRLDPGAAEPVPVTDSFLRPNGLCFSPDESLVYVADSSTERHHVRVFRVMADNRLSPHPPAPSPSVERGSGDVFATIEPGVPDGMRVDKGGRVYITAGDGVHVYSPGGQCLGRIRVPEVTANCTFGGSDGRTLFMTASTGLYAVKLNASGARLPR